MQKLMKLIPDDLDLKEYRASHLHGLTPELKTRLIYHSERILAFCEVRNFYGGTISNAFARLLDNTEEKFIAVPVNKLTILPENEQKHFGIKCGLHTDCLPLIETIPLDKSHLLRNAPFWQQATKDWNKIVNAPHVLVNMIGLAKNLLINFRQKLYPRGSAREQSPYEKLGYFANPDYREIAKLDKNKSYTLLAELAKIVWLAYQMEWWLIVSQRTIKQVGLGKLEGFDKAFYTLESFPTDFRQVEKWHADQRGSTILTFDSNFKTKKSIVNHPGE